MPAEFLVALIAAGLVAFVGVVGEWLVSRFRSRRYPDIAAGGRQIAAALRGEVDRDGNDLLLRVNVERWPVLVRFSNSDGQPQLNIRIPVVGKLAFFLCAAQQALHSPRAGATYRRRTV